jgi:hypothetical protein
MTDITYSSEDRHTGTRLGNCARCGGRLWQRDGEPVSCERCVTGLGPQPPDTLDDSGERIRYKHSEAEGKVVATRTRVKK